MNNNKKLHWYNFVFQDSTPRGYCVKNRIWGYTKNHVTSQAITEAKKDALVTRDAVLLNVSYLGCMTKKEFGEDEK